MKIFFYLLLPFLFLLTSCDSDDPDIENEEEVITTLTYTLSPASGSDVVLSFRDIDGDGGNSPVINVSGDLMANQTYQGSLDLLNEAESPAESITEEIEEEDDEHQFFFESNVAGLSVSYTDQDGNGNPVGLATELTTGAAGSGTLTIILRHEPTKPAITAAEAGGETDIEVSFSINVN